MAQVNDIANTVMSLSWPSSETPLGGDASATLAVLRSASYAAAAAIGGDPMAMTPAQVMRGTTGVVVPVLATLALAACLWLAASWWRKYERFRRFELAMPGEHSLPVLGNCLEMMRITEDNAFEIVLGLWGGRNTELSRASLFGQLFVFVSDPDHIGKVIRDRRFNDKPWLMYSPMSDVLGQGLVTSSGSYWKRHRTLVQPTFHLEVLERFVDVFAEEAVAYVNRMRDMLGVDVEFAEEMHKATANSVLRTTLSSTIMDCDKDDLEAVVLGVTKCLKTVNARSVRPLLWSSFVFKYTAMGREQAEYKALTNRYMDMLIQRKTEALLGTDKDEATSGIEGKLGFKERKTFLDLVLEGVLAGVNNMTHDEIKDECATMFGTAVETSVTALTFVFKMLSIRPDIQDKVYAELVDVFGYGDRLVTDTDLPKLEYTERVIKETLRIFPIGPFISRNVTEDVELCGKHIPAGANIIINIFSAHRDARFHPDPLNFDPDRFLPERTATWHPHCYMPFSAGPRNCIGQRYAMMQMKTIMSTTLRAYRIMPADDGISHPSQFPLTFDIALRMIGGTKVRFEHRRAAADAA